MRLQSELRRREGRARGVGGGLTSRQRQLKKSVAAVESERLELEKKLATVQEHADTYQVSLDKQLDAQKRRIAKMQGKVDEVRQQLKGCDAQLRTLQSQRDSLRQQAHNLREHNSGADGGSRTSRSLTAGEPSAGGVDDGSITSPASHPGHGGVACVGAAVCCGRRHYRGRDGTQVT